MARINGNNRNNELRGTRGDDRIDGKGGNDTIEGRRGDDDLYGLREIPWDMWRFGGAVVGVLLAYLLLAERNPFFAIFGLAGVFAPRFIRAFLIRQRRAAMNRQVRDLVFLLRPALGVHGGFRPALEQVHARLEPGVVKARLHYHLQDSFIVEPEQIIEALAHDLHSTEMERLTIGIRAARKGGLSYVEAIVMAAEETKERIHEDAKLAIEETPMRLMIPMLILLFPPIMVLTLYPMVALVLALMSSPAMGGSGVTW